MSDETSVSATGYTDDAHRMMAGRTAARDAEFLLPHLQPGMRLLDCGCGQGSITVGLAQAVAPGEVVGLDVDPDQVARARAHARDAGVENVSFDTGDAYALPFPDASFDAVFANQLLVWVARPAAVLREFRRVLKPGGVVGLQTLDPSVWVLHPSTPLLDRLPPLLIRVWEHLGASFRFGHQQRQALLDAGFARSEAIGGWAGGGTPATLAQFLLPDRSLRMPEFRQASIAQGWADAATLDTMATELQAFKSQPGAFFAMLRCAAVGWA
jgi:ubiquinone/menaquinone biosynthesis C-methylase UbiE